MKHVIVRLIASVMLLFGAAQAHAGLVFVYEFQLLQCELVEDSGPCAESLFNRMSIRLDESAISAHSAQLHYVQPCCGGQPATYSSLGIAGFTAFGGAFGNASPPFCSISSCEADISVEVASDGLSLAAGLFRHDGVDAQMSMTGANGLWTGRSSADFPGSRANFTGVWSLGAVLPEPGSLALAAAAVLALCAASCRRKHYRGLVG